MKKRKFLPIFFLLFFVVSCSEPVVSLPSHVRSIAIPTFKNLSNRPGLELDVTQRVLHEFVASSVVGVTPRPDEADAVLYGEIYDYKRTPISWDQTNRIVQYKIQISVRIRFVDRRTGEVFWSEDEVDGVTSYSLLSSPPETEEAAIFKAADELARDVYFLMAEGRQFSEDEVVFTQDSRIPPGQVDRR